MPQALQRGVPSSAYLHKGVLSVLQEAQWRGARALLPPRLASGPLAGPGVGGPGERLLQARL